MTEDRELRRAKQEVEREHRKTEQRAATSRSLGEWFRQRQQENGWRLIIENLARGSR